MTLWSMIWRCAVCWSMLAMVPAMRSSGRQKHKVVTQDIEKLRNPGGRPLLPWNSQEDAMVLFIGRHLKGCEDKWLKAADLFGDDRGFSALIRRYYILESRAKGSSNDDPIQLDDYTMESLRAALSVGRNADLPWTRKENNLLMYIAHTFPRFQRWKFTNFLFPYRKSRDLSDRYHLLLSNDYVPSPGKANIEKSDICHPHWVPSKLQQQVQQLYDERKGDRWCMEDDTIIYYTATCYPQVDLKSAMQQIHPLLQQPQQYSVRDLQQRARLLRKRFGPIDAMHREFLNRQRYGQSTGPCIRAIESWTPTKTQKEAVANAMRTLL